MQQSSDGGIAIAEPMVIFGVSTTPLIYRSDELTSTDEGL